MVGSLVAESGDEVGREVQAGLVGSRGYFLWLAQFPTPAAPPPACWKDCPGLQSNGSAERILLLWAPAELGLHKWG